MIKITYEYSCDFCGKEIKETESFCINPNMVIQQPSRNYAIGHHHVCDCCRNAAEKLTITFLRERAQFNPPCPK